MGKVESGGEWKQDMQEVERSFRQRRCLSAFAPSPSSSELSGPLTFAAVHASLVLGLQQA